MHYFMRNISSPIITTMSDGSEQLLAEDEQETIRSDALKSPQLEFDYEIAQISPLDHVGIETDHLSPRKAIRTVREEKEEEEEEEKKEGGKTSFREEHELVEEDGENNDGFRTPTSSDHKIPVMTQCPPTPMKPKPTKKRKLSSLSMLSDDRHREVIDLDLSEEVESLLQPTHRNEVKKARRDGNNN